ncbi:Cysteine-rich repeat secretory protein 38 [Nymphaea thermarum]|nr:Cysteine-rich repeat secretory protein 38 [Nymphaea thermarum]
MGMTTAAMGTLKLKFALLLLFFAHSAATNDFITTHCSTSDNFTAGSTFQRNVNTVITSLTANSIPTGFNTTIAGDSANRVYGLALCRGDLTSDECQTCVSTSSAQLAKLCPTSKDAVIWYEYCEMIYSNASFFGVVDTGFRVDWKWVNRNVTNVTLFNNRLGLLFENLTSMATSDPSMLMFATGVIPLSDLEKIYGLVQCTRDLQLEDCKSCLDDAVGYIPKCCNGTQGGQVLKRSCNVRFDTINFFFSRRPSNPSPPSNPPSASVSPS